MIEVSIKEWPPKQCQACLSTDLTYDHSEDHEGEWDLVHCNTCRAVQKYWFEDYGPWPGEKQ